MRMVFVQIIKQSNQIKSSENCGLVFLRKFSEFSDGAKISINNRDKYVWEEIKKFKLDSNMGRRDNPGV